MQTFLRLNLLYRVVSGFHQEKRKLRTGLFVWSFFWRNFPLAQFTHQNVFFGFHDDNSDLSIQFS